MALHQDEAEVSPISRPDSELEKHRGRGEEQEEIEEETASTKEGRLARDARLGLSVPLRNSRSRSSARSVKSYKSHTDGYSHFNEANDEEKQQRADDDANGAQQNPEKEFEVSFDGDADPYNPKNRPYLRKWLIVVIVSSSSLCVTAASALVGSPGFVRMEGDILIREKYTSTYKQLETDFHVSREVATLGLTTFVCGLGLGPMFLRYVHEKNLPEVPMEDRLPCLICYSPLSEFYGRRKIYLCAFGMYFIWLIPCAVAPNIATMLIVRFFDGLAGSAFLSVAGGTVGDMFNRDQLSAPMMVYTASPVSLTTPNTSLSCWLSMNEVRRT